MESNMRVRKMAGLALLTLDASPAFAQDAPPQLNLCPPTIHKTCFIGYVTASHKISVMISSIDIDPARRPRGRSRPARSFQIGSVVMLDAKGKGKDAITDNSSPWRIHC